MLLAFAWQVPILNSSGIVDSYSLPGLYAEPETLTHNRTTGLTYLGGCLYDWELRLCAPGLVILNGLSAVDTIAFSSPSEEYGRVLHIEPHPNSSLVYVWKGDSVLHVLDGAVPLTNLPFEGQLTWPYVDAFNISPISNLLYLMTIVEGQPRLNIYDGTELVDTLESPALRGEDNWHIRGSDHSDIAVVVDGSHMDWGCQRSYHATFIRGTTVLGTTELHDFPEDVAIADNSVYFTSTPCNNFPDSIYRVPLFDTFTVSGKVIDGYGYPIQDVAIVTDSGLGGRIDYTGQYSVTGLITGTHTITPIKDGYVFYPPSITVSVPLITSNEISLVLVNL